MHDDFEMIDATDSDGDEWRIVMAMFPVAGPARFAWLVSGGAHRMPRPCYAWQPQLGELCIGRKTDVAGFRAVKYLRWNRAERGATSCGIREPRMR